MDNLCNNCIHKDVCGRYAATWGMKTCENFMEMPKKGKWEQRKDAFGFVRCSVCHDCNIYDDWADGKKWSFCPNCGADMRGDQCE
jgi:hypothetical protein